MITGADIRTETRAGSLERGEVGRALVGPLAVPASGAEEAPVRRAGGRTEPEVAVLAMGRSRDAFLPRVVEGLSARPPQPGVAVPSEDLVALVDLECGPKVDPQDPPRSFAVGLLQWPRLDLVLEGSVPLLMVRDDAPHVLEPDRDTGRRVRSLTLRRGDRLMLCTHDLELRVGREGLLEALRLAADAGAVCRRVLDARGPAPHDDVVVTALFGTGEVQDPEVAPLELEARADEPTIEPEDPPLASV